MIEQTRFGTRITVHQHFDEAVQSAKRVLAEQSLSVLSEVNLASHLQGGPKCTLLGAWTALSSRAVEREPDIGAILQSNIVIYEEAAGRCVVSAVDPFNALEVTGPDVLIEEAVLDSRERLRRAFAAL
jgi:hypothetical protein